jgi:aminopeptidase N
MLERHVAPDALFDAMIRALPLEDDEQNAQRLLAYVSRTFWRHLDPEPRAARAGAAEAALRTGLAQARTASQKSAWFNTYRDVVTTPAGVAWLTRIWGREERVPGLTFAEPDEITLALELAVREAPQWADILTTQHERIQNPDRKARFAFVMPALSADPAVREEAFERFRHLENRRREPWVLEAMAYLNHPLRAAHARRFVGPSLDLLQEIQRSGDIFFPIRWTEAALWGHRSPEAAAIVRRFLDDQVDYPQRLRWIILTAADELFRAAAR